MFTDIFKSSYFGSHILYIIIVGSFILMPSLVKAQMFSMTNSHQESSVIPRFHIYAGIGPAHFNYRPKDNNGVYAFDGEVGHLILDATNFKLFFAKGFGLGPISYFEAGIQGGYEFPVYHSHSIRLQVPLQLQAGITTVTNDNQVISARNPSFREGTISVRTGIDFKVRMSPLFRLGIGVVPHAGLAYSTGRYNGGGSVLGAEGKFRLFFDHLFGNVGLSLGYNYDFRKFNVKGSLFDYNSIENSFLIGVTF